MDSALTGFLVVFGTFHVLLVVVPIQHTLRATISRGSKLFWCAFILLLPFIGVAVFHFKFKTGLFQGAAHETSAAGERARSGTLSPDDHD